MPAQLIVRTHQIAPIRVAKTAFGLAEDPSSLITATSSPLGDIAATEASTFPDEGIVLPKESAFASSTLRFRNGNTLEIALAEEMMDSTEISQASARVKGDASILRNEMRCPPTSRAIERI